MSLFPFCYSLFSDRTIRNFVKIINALCREQLEHNDTTGHDRPAFWINLNSLSSNSFDKKVLLQRKCSYNHSGTTTNFCELILKSTLDVVPTLPLCRIKYTLNPPKTIQINKTDVSLSVHYMHSSKYLHYVNFSKFGTCRFWICKRMCVCCYVRLSVCLSVCHLP